MVYNLCHFKVLDPIFELLSFFIDSQYEQCWARIIFSSTRHRGVFSIFFLTSSPFWVTRQKFSNESQKIIPRHTFFSFFMPISAQPTSSSFSGQSPPLPLQRSSSTPPASGQPHPSPSSGNPSSNFTPPNPAVIFHPFLRLLVFQREWCKDEGRGDGRRVTGVGRQETRDEI